MYGLILWGGAVDVTRMLRIQKRAPRIFYGAGRLAQCRHLFLRKRILTIGCALPEAEQNWPYTSVDKTVQQPPNICKKPAGQEILKGIEGVAGGEAVELPQRRRSDAEFNDEKLHREVTNFLPNNQLLYIHISVYDSTVSLYQLVNDFQNGELGD
ncbi:hypothetical protein LSTR_LSTR009639 [Laodelphax striatellus]|uniref:Uncharacterized protein n=1 Tax=Laodelphax striatellus TaxID=195883 RepID=A0A482WNC5_LAOST|nr:hypothetical protein LSTR_LSTR009639 [Laodelphax striatellus]